MKVAWQTRSPLLHNSIVAQHLDPRANGGNAYDFQAAMAIGSELSLAADKQSVYTSSDNPFSYWLKMRKYLTQANARVLEPYPIVFGGRFSETKNIAMIHHVDAHAETGGIKHKWFYKRLFSRIKTFDTVVTVSSFWKRYLEQKGCDNVKVIYNSFNPKEYQYTEEQITLFCKKYDFDPEKPIVYIGNAAPGKGVYEVYEALKGSNYQMVMTGGTNKAADLPVKFLSLEQDEYKMMIASCSVVLTMSSMMEGWNRVAHEAMLSKVPVIGTGSGGMRELLEGGKQLITTDYSALPSLLANCIENRVEQGANGYAYVSQFDDAYFKKEWLALFQ